MEENPYQSPLSDVQARGEQLPVNVKIPKRIYFIAVFVFFVVAQFLMSLQRALLSTGSYGSFPEIAAVSIPVIALWLSIAVGFFNSRALIIAAVSMIFIAVSMLAGLGLSIVSGEAGMGMFAFTSVMVGLLGYCAWYCLRKETLAAARQRAAYRNFMALSKEVQKRIKKNKGVGIK